jgi:hypothetical protein
MKTNRMFFDKIRTSQVTGTAKNRSNTCSALPWNDPNPSKIVHEENKNKPGINVHGEV